jgi:isoleucyl-tRNA synthetase
VLTEKLQTEVLADFDRYEFHLAVQKFVGFCSEDLGSFYLDILKDRLYTSGENSQARRAAQSALHHITQTMMRLMAPILSFTANEIWQTLDLDKDATVFEELWYDLPAHGLSNAQITDWKNIIEVRALANKAIEEKRGLGEVGSSLQAEITITVDSAAYDSLARMEDALRFVFITSQAKVEKQSGSGLTFKVAASQHAKCDRCWHYREDVGASAEHPTICGRCVSNLFGEGEKRTHA